MTLEEWAKREGLTYYKSAWLLDEYGLLEWVGEMRHCFDCATEYVFREAGGHADGQLIRQTVLGDYTQRAFIIEADLDALTAESFPSVE